MPHSWTRQSTKSLKCSHLEKGGSEAAPQWLDPRDEGNPLLDFFFFCNTEHRRWQGVIDWSSFWTMKHYKRNSNCHGPGLHVVQPFGQVCVKPSHLTFKTGLLVAVTITAAAYQCEQTHMLEIGNITRKQIWGRLNENVWSPLPTPLF